MKKIISDIGALLKRELKIISGDGSIILTIFIAPLLYMFLLGTIYQHKDVDSVPMAVVDMDHTQLSRTYIRFIDATQKVTVTHSPENFEEAKDLFYRMDVFGVLVLPKGFEKNLLTMQGTDVVLYLNNSRFLMSNEINKSVQKVALMVGAGVRLKYFTETGTHPKEAMEMVMPVKPEVNFMNNIFNNYGYFLLPGLLFLILQQTLLIGLGESVSIEREEKLLPTWLRQSRSIFVSILGKNSFYLLLYLAYAVLIFGAIFPFFGLPVKGSFLQLGLLILLFVIAMILFTNLLASFFRKQIVFMEIMAFTSYPIFLITGYSFPRYALPQIYVWISYILPTTPFLESIVKITQQGVGFEAVSHNYLILLMQIIVLYALLHWRLRWLRKNFPEADVIEAEGQTI